MNELDKKIVEAMRKEDAELFQEVGSEPGVFEMLFEAFRGKRRWLNMLGAVWTLIFLLLGIASAVAFFQAGETRDQLMWALACILCMSVVVMFKIWYWMEMQRIIVMREIKRVELQIARLAARIRD